MQHTAPMSQSAPVVRRTQRSMVGALVLLLWCALSVGGGATAAAEATDEPTTQTLTLEEGWNLVSLHTAPADPSFGAVLEGITDQLVGIQDQRGRLYLPQEEIIQIDTWQVDESYLIYMAAAATLAVEGVRVRPELTEVPLHEGWNLIPTLHANPLPVTAAFDSITDVLLLAKDDLGNLYSPALDLVMFDDLHPGRGYWLYATDASTLIYPEDPTLAPLPTEVPTLADALALTDLEVGQQVQVQGYHTPGDGGGGLFDVTDDACATDGGTCFALDEDVSEVWEHTTSHNLTSPYTLTPHQLVWGSITVQYGTTPEETIPHELMHGHGTAASNQSLDWVDYGGGTIGANSASFFGVRQQAGYGTSAPFIIRYKTVESPRRLKRTGVTDSVDIRWWGAKPADPNDPYNARNDIAYAINAAAKLYDAGGIDWAHVDIPGEFYYRYTIRVRNGVNLRGMGDAVYGDAADGNPTRGKLTIAPGLQMDHRLGLLTSTEYDILHGMRMTEVDLTHEYMVEKVGMEDLEVYGNVAGNQQVIDGVDYEGANIKQQLQEANSWNGFASKGVNSWTTPENATAHFYRVYVHDFPGNGLGMNNALDFTPSEYVRIGDAQKNHQLYRTKGHHKNWQIDGAGWASLLKVTEATFENLTMYLGPNNFADLPGWGETWVTPFDHHGANFGANPVDDADLIARNNIEVDNFTIDISVGNDGNVEIFAGVGYKGHYRNGTILTTPDVKTTIFQPASGSNLPVNSYVFDNIEVIDQGGGITFTAFAAPYTHNTFRNITVHGSPEVVTHDFWGFRPLSKSNPWGQPYDESDPLAGNFVYPQGTSGRLDIDNVDFQKPIDGWAFRATNIPSGDLLPYDIFATNLKVDNQFLGYARGILHSATGSRAIRLYLHDSTINVYPATRDFRPDATHWNITHPEQTLRLRDVVDRTGRSSDRTGTFASTSSDEGQDYVLIETNLLSYANETEAVITSGPGDLTVESVQIANADGSIRDQLMPDGDTYEHRDPYLRVNLSRALAAGEALTLDWAARCTPLDMFSPTGVFKARIVDDVTISDGTPLTIDLLGTMASMESSDVIAYSATSGDEAIVTVSMDEHERFLTLTPQGPGTTTVTVTGGISGIGTATEEVQVVVE